MKTLEQLAKLMQDNTGNPHELSKLHMEIAGDYMSLSSLLIPIQETKPQKWIAIKKSGDDKMLSDKLTEMSWRITDEGKLEHSIELKMKALEKAMASLKNNQFVLNQEARNQY